MKNKAQPLIIHVLGTSGRVKDSHMGLLVDGKVHLLEDVENFDELMKRIKNL